LENPAVPIGYLNHPFKKTTGEHREETLHDTFSYLDEFRLQSVWKHDGSEYSIDYNVIEQCKIILVHNRGALFNETIFKLRTLGKQIVYYMDDYLLELPIKHTLYPYYRALNPRIISMIEHSDICVTGSAYSASLLSNYSNVTSIEAGVNLHLWQLPIAKAPREDDKPVIAFFGDENDLEALSFIKPFLERLQKRYGDTVHIRVFGLNVETYKLMPFRNYEVVNLKIPNYAEWIHFLRAQHIDIALMPNRKDPYSQGKSIGRALDFSLSTIPVVCSHTEPFTSFIDHNINGFLCEDALDQWMNAVETLLSSEELRVTIANQAFTKAITTLSAQHSAKKWRNLLNNLPTIESIPIEATVLNGMRWSKYQINSLERYPAWLNNRRFRPEDIPVWAREAEKWTHLPSISLYIIADEETIGLLNYTIDTLANQLYPAWKLTLISTFPSPNPIFETHEQLRWICTDQNPYECIQNNLETDTSEWIIITDKADLFEPQAFASFIHVANTHSNAELIYCDHGLVSTDNLLSEPQFKPDLNLDMLRAYDYIDGTFAVRKTLLSRIGGVNGRYPYAEHYDLLLRAVNAKAEIIHIDDLLWHKRIRLLSPEEKQLHDISHRLSLMLHLQEASITAQVISGSVSGTTRILYLHDQTPKISIIIPTKNKIDYLRRCIDSILAKTNYNNYEIIIVDNASDEIDAIAYLDDLRHTRSSNIQIIPYHESFNYSKANNLGVKAATGEVFLFLNNDTEVLHENWLDVMVSHICRNEVGIVGPRLLFSDGSIQHAGVVLGMRGPAGNIFGYLNTHETGYMNRLQIEQNYSAVTGAALMIKRSVFDAVSGFNATDYLNHYSDIDLCLKVIDKGFKIVWTPYATLTHHESVSFKSDVDSTLIETKNTRFIQDQEAFIRLWNSRLEHDPCYNRNLDMSSTDIQINIDDLPHWSLLTSSTPRIWAIPRGYDGGGEYRLISPMNGLDKAGLAQVHIGWNYYGYPFLINRHRPDTIIAQTPLHDHQLQFLETIQPYFNGHIIFEIDDLLTNIPKDNAAYNRQYANIKDRLATALKSCDRMVVSTEPLKRTYSYLIDDIRVVKNYLSLTRWGNITPKRFNSPKPRVGWAGSPFHAGDLKVIEHIVKTLKDDVHWVFMGMLPEGAKEYVHEFHPAVSLDEYPSKLAELGLDLALVPLELNPFNEAKSNLRLLELGIMGWPIICSDAYPYRNAPVTIVKNNNKAWLKAIKKKLSDRQALREEGENLRRWVMENFILENNLEEILPNYL
ncbi:MAG: glycosyltransferase, partial [Sulfuricurvum sp.]|nr:glycosyltransferase [Sulfuricurvum sp.]